MTKCHAGISVHDCSVYSLHSTPTTLRAEQNACSIVDQPRSFHNSASPALKIEQPLLQ